MLKQHILVELKQFIHAVANHRGNPQSITSAQLVRSSLNLLEDLPAAREVVFEYFALVFDASVGSYVAFMSADTKGATPPEDEFITDIQEALENLVTKGTAAWSPLIASWSLELVGKLSDKYWPTRKLDIGAACNLWLSCGAMRCLVGLIASCFRKLTNVEAEVCVGTLLATFRKYTPTFDWVVARLGGCFPLKIISQILQVGLKKFSEDCRCRFDSEIGILDYLSFAHENDLKHAMKELLDDGFNPKKPIHVEIIPFLMQISNYSDAILQTATSVFLEMYNESLHEVLVRKTPLWMQNKAFVEMQPSLNNIALKLKSDGAKMLISVAKLADKHTWCQEFLEWTLVELEQIILLNRSCPLLTDLATDESKYFLWRSCASANLMEQQTAVRLLLIVSSQYSHIYHQTLSELLQRSYEINRHGIGALIRVIGGIAGLVEFPTVNPGLEMSLEEVLLKEQLNAGKNRASSLHTFRNLVSLVKLENISATPFLRQQPITAALLESLPKVLQIFDCAINRLLNEMERARTESCRSEMQVKRPKVEENAMEVDDVPHSKPSESAQLVHTIVELLNCIDAGSKNHLLPVGDSLKLACLSVKYFFWCLMEKSPTLRSTCISRVLSLFRRQCSARKFSRQSCLRELLEGGLHTFGYLFGAYEEPDSEGTGIPENEKLINLNRKQGLGPNAYRSVLHAGVIGKGIKEKSEPKGLEPDPEMKNFYLRAIDACCTDFETPNSTEGYSAVSLMLVELVSTDVMYNGLPFPDEEFTKFTIERDMLIRRAFSLSPILWVLLCFLATHRPALCFSSVLLRALVASCLHQWRARNVNKTQLADENDELLCCTRKTLEILAMGQLLPPPLSNLHSIIGYFEAAEIALVLKECVWNYLKDHVPSPALFQCDATGLQWRNPKASKIPPQYVDTLRNLMQKKLPKLGVHYYEMFVMPELNCAKEEN